MTNSNNLWQMGVAQAVQAGQRCACTTVGEALSHGDVGFAQQAVTGELALMVNGVCYFLTSSSSAEVARPKDGLCRCLVGYFDHYAPVFLSGDLLSLSQLGRILDERPEVAKKRNHPQLLLGAGTLGRAVLSGPANPQPNDDALDDRALGKTVIQVNGVSGLIVGRRVPGYLTPGEPEGWRYGFVSEDHKVMGRLLGASELSVACQLSVYGGIESCLPTSRAFDELVLS